MRIKWVSEQVIVSGNGKLHGYAKSIIPGELFFRVVKLLFLFAGTINPVIGNPESGSVVTVVIQSVIAV